MEKGKQAPAGAKEFRIKPVVETKISTPDGTPPKVTFTATEKLQIQTEAQRAVNSRIIRGELPPRIK